jgi:Protein of unknown function, DUF547
MRRLLCCLAALLVISVEALAAPSADPWPFWAANDPASTAALDFGFWNGFLARYLMSGPDGINRLAYGAVTLSDRHALDKDLARLAAVPIRGYARPQQMAYWINLYNALTVETVLAHYPVDSIRDISISPGLFSRGPWDRKLVTVEGQALSLNDIEHRILRPIWHDPRIHYAVNCASLGCPNLAPSAYEANRLDNMLDAAARAYVNHPRGAAVNSGKLTVSSIYRWYQADFGGSEAGVIEHLKRYAEPPLAQALRGVTGIADDRYDWRLNDAYGGHADVVGRPTNLHAVWHSGILSAAHIGDERAYAM